MRVQVEDAQRVERPAGAEEVSEVAGERRGVTGHVADRPGTGLAQDRGAATLPSGAAAAAEVVRSLGAGPAVVVGQSLGGAVALQLATDFPQLVAGLVLCSTARNALLSARCACGMGKCGYRASLASAAAICTRSVGRGGATSG